jgi:putative heme-binding domain-containing protein
VPLLLQTLRDTQQSTFNRSMAALALAKADDADAFLSLFEILPKIPSGGNGSDLDKAKNAFYNAPRLENHHQRFEALAANPQEPLAKEADLVLLKLAKRTSGAPESRIMSQKALDDGWKTNAPRRIQIINAMKQARTSLASLELPLVQALEDADATVKSAADGLVKQLKLNPEKIRAAAKPSGPLISTLKGEEVLMEVTKLKGDRARGEVLFVQQGCVNCHTVSQGQPLKGPYLGNIAQTYKRAELAESILHPSKTISQGFATNVFSLKDGAVQVGFVVKESPDNIQIRNIAGEEMTIPSSAVAYRTTDSKSLMPEGLLGNLSVKEFAGMLDYLEHLAEQGK